MHHYPPSVVEMDGNIEKHYDIYTRLLKDRIVFLDDEVDDSMASSLVAQLLFLASDAPDKDISLYIMSPGGSVTAGLAIYDTMKFLPCDVRTYCLGEACSMGSFLLAAGTKGKRFVLPNARVMIHQVAGGAQGKATDVKITLDELMYTKERLNRLLAENCGQDYEKVCQDTERDHWMSAEEAVAYGLADKVVSNVKESK